MKIIVTNNTGYKLQVHCGLVVPGEPSEMDVTEEQLKSMRQDPRLTFFDSMPKSAGKAPPPLSPTKEDDQGGGAAPSQTKARGKKKR